MSPMIPWREEHRTGRASLEAVTALLQRIRAAHPTACLYEAADLQWWWRMPRPTDDVPQLFWFDDTGRPAAAAIVTAWRDHVAVDPLILPEAGPGRLVDVLERGLAHAASLGYEAVSLEVDPAEHDVTDWLGRHGFTEDDGMFEGWLDTATRPPVSALADGYRLRSRQQEPAGTHHLAARSGPEVEARLQQTSLYRQDLDLLVLGPDGDVAASGLFWFDPVTATGLVEPMRTEEAHQRRGLARHVLTAGIARLAEAGARRVKICWEPDHPASGPLYTSVGFRPHRRTRTYAGATVIPPSSVEPC